jgi:hypothetical protein
MTGCHPTDYMCMHVYVEDENRVVDVICDVLFIQESCFTLLAFATPSLFYLRRPNMTMEELRFSQRMKSRKMFPRITYICKPIWVSPVISIAMVSLYDLIIHCFIGFMSLIVSPLEYFYVALDVLETDDNELDARIAQSIDAYAEPKSFCLETALLLMECSWQAYYVTPKLKKSPDTCTAHRPRTEGQKKHSKTESQPLLDRDTSATSEGSYFSTLMGSGLKAHMDVAQYGLHLVKSFSNHDGDITGYAATDNCKFISLG